MLFHTVLHPSEEVTSYPKLHDRTYEDDACWLSGRLLLSQLIQSRSTSLWNGDVHSRRGPPMSINNQDSPPQTCPKTNLI